MNNPPTIIKFYGTKWCADCHRSRKFLDEKNVAYEVIDIDEDPGAADEVARINNGYKSIPTFVFSDGSVLTEPDIQDLALKLQIS